LTTTNTQFFDGLRQNESIEKLTLLCDGHDIGVIGCAILSAYHGSNLSCLCIWNCELENGSAIATTLRCCPNLKEINIFSSTFNSQLIPVIEEGRGLEKLDLEETDIGNDVCEALASLISDSDSNLHTLYLSNNNISSINATTIANSLAKNSKLKRLRLDQNQIDQGVVDGLNRVLCNTESINSTYLSNHTLRDLYVGSLSRSEKFDLFTSLVVMNKERNKSHVAILKILKYHPNIDMEPLYAWDSEEKWTLKSLPYVVDWFERAEEAVGQLGTYVRKRENYKVSQKKLSAIYQFALDMPLLFVPSSKINVDCKRRKMSG